MQRTAIAVAVFDLSSPTGTWAYVAPLILQLVGGLCNPSIGLNDSIGGLLVDITQILISFAQWWLGVGLESVALVCAGYIAASLNIPAIIRRERRSMTALQRPLFVSTMIALLTVPVLAVNGNRDIATAIIEAWYGLPYTAALVALGTVWVATLIQERRRWPRGM